MEPKGTSYLELTALPEVGPLLLDPRPAWLFGNAGARVLWANAAGLTYFGVERAESLLTRTFPPSSPLTQHVSRLTRLLPAGQPRLERLRVPVGLSIDSFVASATKLRLPAGDAVLVVSEMPVREPRDGWAGLLVRALSTDDASALLLRPDGSTIAGRPLPSPAVVALASAVRGRGVSRLDIADGDDLRLAAVVPVSAPSGDAVLAVIGPIVGTAARAPGPAAPSESAATAPRRLRRKKPAGEGEVAAPPRSPADQAKPTTLAPAAARVPPATAPTPAPDQLPHPAGGSGAPLETTAAKDETPGIARPMAEPIGVGERPAATVAAAVAPPAAPAPPLPADGRDRSETAESAAGAPAGTRDADQRPPPADADGAPATPARQPAGAPVRFVFQMDDAGRFTFVSPEFASVVGPDAAAAVGRRWSELADRWHLDPAGAVARALARRDTWSGVTVYWPVQGGGEAVAVDLAALPAFARDRTFEGFRGFGVVRPGDRRPVAPGAAAAGLPPDDRPRPAESSEPPETAAAADSAVDRSAKGVPPAASAPQDGGTAQTSAGMASTRPEAGAALPEPSNVIKLPAAPLPSGTAAEPQLAPPEQDAFRRIAEALRAGMPRRPTLDELASPAAGETPIVRPSEKPDAGPLPGAAIFGRRPEPPAAPLPATEPAAADGPAAPREARLLDALPVAALVFRGARALHANRAFLDRLGYASLADLAAAGGADAIFPAESRNPVGRPNPDQSRIVLRQRGGELLAVEARLHQVPWADGSALMLTLGPAAAADPSRIAELEAVLDTATDGVIVIDGAARIVSVNRSAEALFGIESAEVAGAPLVTLLAEESRRAALDYLDGLSRNGVASVLNDGREVIGKVPRGGLIPLFMTMGRLGATGKYCAVLRDITQWKNAEEELVAARRAAEIANGQKSDFLAKISHEIRTPLNAIIGFSELMMEERFGPVGNDRYREYLRDINRSGALLMSLINDLLDLSKIEAGKMELAFEAVQANDIVQECVALMQPQANRERVIIRSSLPPGVPRVVADSRSLRQIVLNLLSNAVKFTPAGGQVIVSTTLEDSGEVVLRIRDTGLGMSPVDLEAALKPFRQLTTSGRARNDGTGLGLPLTKALVEANRASFAIDSTVGEGTLVRVTFPTERVLAG